MSTAEVTCPAGTIVGVSDGAVDTYHSVTYSQIPGQFENAQPAARGMYIDATEPRPQDIALTITVPTGTTDADDLPVIAYIHGGRFEHGTHADPRAAGASNAQQGVIQVQIGYRVGLAGMARFHDDLPNHFRGIDDCALALEWIQHNIEAFGGDPTNVTLVGQSAGATTALWLARKDHYRGAFRRILAMSPCFPRESYEQRETSLQAAFFGRRVTREMLSSISEKSVRRAYNRYRTHHSLDMALGPTPLEPRDMVEIDTVVTTVRDEFYTNPMAAQADRFGMGAAMVKAIGPKMGLVPAHANEWIAAARAISAKHIAGRFVGDSCNRRWVDQVSEQAPGRVWQMEFVRDELSPAYHSRDIRPMFGNNPDAAGDGLNAWLISYAHTGQTGQPEYDPEGGRVVTRMDLSGDNKAEVRDPLGYIRQAFVPLPPTT